ncbi:hypothetical protein H6F89_12375 [Cyanobacteria bacterium FACHB-63]|nr:hypothetical protein [Cyanobacteria bacterium FACHB-63]
MQPSSFRDSEATPKAPAADEVGGMFDAFVSLEEISPELDWMETIADSWGIPYNATSAAPKAQEP